MKQSAIARTKRIATMALLIVCMSMGAILHSCSKKSSGGTTTIDECVGVVCDNGGHCAAGTCVCPTGWSGTYCQTAVTGNIKFVNTSVNPYLLKIDGVNYSILEGGHSITLPVNIGTHNCEVMQQSGFTGTPINHTYTVTVDAAETATINFP